MRVWDYIVAFAELEEFNRAVEEEWNLPVDDLNMYSPVEMDEGITFFSEMSEWERQHRPPRRLRRHKRDHRQRYKHPDERKDYLWFDIDKVAHSPRSTLRSRRGEICPPVPTDYEAARVDALLEERGWPVEDIQLNNIDFDADN